jgi:hypothetical protein
MFIKEGKIFSFPNYIPKKTDEVKHYMPHPVIFLKSEPGTRNRKRFVEIRSKDKKNNLSIDQPASLEGGRLREISLLLYYYRFNPVSWTG